jgi:hypothetical protein
MHTPIEHDTSKDAIEISRLKRDLIEAETTITELVADLRASRESYGLLANAYLKVRELQKEETSMLNYVLSDSSSISLYIKGDGYLFDREQLQEEMTNNPDLF